MANAVQTRITAAEYARLPETNLPTELIEGEMIQMPAPRYAHQAAVFAIAKLVERAAPGGTTVISPSDVYLDDLNVVQPDVFWVSGPESRCRLGEDGWWHGAPDLVVEILSEGTALRDRREKFALYEKHGTREYWIVDPAARYVEVWALAGGAFGRLGLFGAEESFESLLLGAKVELKGVFSKSA